MQLTSVGFAEETLPNPSSVTDKICWCMAKKPGYAEAYCWKYVRGALYWLTDWLTGTAVGGGIGGLNDTDGYASGDIRVQNIIATEDWQEHIHKLES